MSSLENALRIIDVIGPEQPVLRVGEISRMLGIPKSSVSRLLQSMSASGLLEREAAGQGYLVGPRAVTLATLYRNRFSALDDADKAVAGLILRFSFTGYVSALSGTEIILLRVRQGTYPLRHVREVGSRLPAFDTAMGLSLLSKLPDVELRRLHQQAAATHQMTPRWNAVESRIAEIRDVGFIIAGSVLNPGITTIAAPVLHHCSDDVFAISVAYPDNAIDKTTESEIIEGVKGVRL